MSEFEAIARYFVSLTQGRSEALCLKDDAAILQIPQGQELVVSSDTLNEGVHFLVEASPEDVASKVLRVNLSDMAAMGATPYAYQLNIAFPQMPSDDWLENFTQGLLQDQKEFSVFCSGGDTTSTKGSLSVSITMMGLVPTGRACLRSGARAGDYIILSGPVGDAFLGLEVLCENLECEDAAYFKGLYHRPQPRVDLVRNIREYAHAAIDVSDGCVADLDHICRASGVCAIVEVDDKMFSEFARKVLVTGKYSHQDLLSGGDDYQLLLAVPEKNIAKFKGCLVIGRFCEASQCDESVEVFDSGKEKLSFRSKGWAHFS